MKKTITFLILVAGYLSLIGNVTALENNTVLGYEKPEVCLKTNIRCILKKQGDTLYWCLKSSLQRNLDTYRTTTPIKKTDREILGNCAKIIPIRE